MNRKRNIKKAIETQRKRLDRMAGQRENLTMLLDEAKRMDWLIGVYETRRTAECVGKDS